MQASDRFNINSQLEHLQAKYVGTGHADLTRFEWAVNIHRDSYASYVGHYPILAYFAVAENESIGRERYNFMQVCLLYAFFVCVCVCVWSMSSHLVKIRYLNFVGVEFSKFLFISPFNFSISWIWSWWGLFLLWNLDGKCVTDLTLKMPQ
ncbi:uncharacterized protein At4g14342 isoform X1 [Salvia miltiorrhiza]|uniref:uncharacterized protein At4g14342 isoform X1 n=1 Tax=Salvia miltiorrhiza TaxID=226208 RepID=UPI0025AD6CF6|nr:uncharacterized protein At4g14342 isoform X1 [Salvia miltiorrhiza]